MKYSEFIDKIKENKRYEHGIIKTKLHYESEEEIDIFYVIKKSEKPNSPYAIFFNGGPGVGFTQNFFEHKMYEGFWDNINIVFMDQRGTGFSSYRPEKISDYKFFTSRYISFDAEQLRKYIIGDEKWIVFGQSFGGHIVRKYMELYAENSLIGISHGYGESDPFIMKKNIEKQLYIKVGEYFLSYENDKYTLLNLLEKLQPDDILGTGDRIIKGRDILDIFSFYFGLYPFDKLHNMIEKYTGEHGKELFLKDIKIIGDIILNAGNLNRVVAYIDLIYGVTDKEIYNRVEEELESENIKIEEQFFSLVRLAKNIVDISRDSEKLNKMFELGGFQPDPIDYEILCKNLSEHKKELFIFGSTNDTITPLEAIKEEMKMAEKFDKGYNQTRFCFSNGNHREWIDNKELFNEVLELINNEND